MCTHRRTISLSCIILFLFLSINPMHNGNGSVGPNNNTGRIIAGVTCAGVATYCIYTLLKYLFSWAQSNTYVHADGGSSVICHNGSVTINGIQINGNVQASSEDRINAYNGIVYMIPAGSHTVTANWSGISVDGQKLSIIEKNGVIEQTDFTLPVKYVAIHRVLAHVKLGSYTRSYVEGDAAFLEAIDIKEIDGKLVASLKDPKKGLRIGNQPALTIYAPCAGNELVVEKSSVELSNATLNKITAKSDALISGTVQGLVHSNLELDGNYSALSLTSTDNYESIIIKAASSATINVKASAEKTTIDANYSTVRLDGDSQNTVIKAKSSATVTQNIQTIGPANALDIDANYSIVNFHSNKNYDTASIKVWSSAQLVNAVINARNVEIDSNYSIVSLVGALCTSDGKLAVAARSSSKVDITDTNSGYTMKEMSLIGNYSNINVDTKNTVERVLIDAVSSASIGLVLGSTQNLVVKNNYSTVTTKGIANEQNVTLRSDAVYRGNSLQSKLCKLVANYSNATISVSEKLSGRAKSSSTVRIHGNPDVRDFTHDKGYVKYFV